MILIVGALAWWAGSRDRRLESTLEDHALDIRGHGQTLKEHDSRIRQAHDRLDTQKEAMAAAEERGRERTELLTGHDEEIEILKKKLQSLEKFRHAAQAAASFFESVG